MIALYDVGRASRAVVATVSWMPRSWSGLLLAAALLLAGSTQQAGATSATWTVNFTGTGSYQSNATLKLASSLCTSTNTSRTDSKFSWSVTWHTVSLASPAVAGSVTGLLTGTAHQSDEQKGCGTSRNCSEAVPFSADQSSAAEQPAILIGKGSVVHKTTYVLTLDLVASAAQMQKCQANDPNDHGFYFAGTPNKENPSATDALAASAQIPLSELQHAGKIIVLAKKTAFNYPQTTDCSDTALGITCAHEQAWSGTITMTRG
jgi:hypothetical protein